MPGRAALRCVFMNEYKIRNLTGNVKIYRIICIFSFCVFLFSLCFQVVISNTTALKGKDFQAYNSRKTEIEKEIALLKYEDSNLSSLDYVEGKAISLGFVPMTEALLPIVPASLAAVAAP